MTDSANIARHLPLMAARQPDHPAVRIPRGRTGDGRLDYLTLTFRELDAEVDAWVAHLQRQDVRPGDRVLVLVRQGLPLIAAAFALFKLGAVPVIIDPGMGRKNFLACVARSRPRVLLGIPLAQIMSHVFRSAFQNVEVRVWVSGSPTARLISGSEIGNRKSEIVNSAPTDLAAVLFTSGSTGAPKGVCYEHGMFDAQVRLVRDAYGIRPGEVDLPMLPIFALFNPALGMTTIVPELDPSRPASLDPAKIVQAIRQEGVTNSFGSPTLWRKIFDHCLAHHIALPSLKRVLCAGAAVPASLWADAPRVLPNGTLHSPYGATEVLPVASVAADEVSLAPAAGSLVGRPLAENRVKIIALHDGPLASLADARELPTGEIGEIIVTGPTVTKAYDALPEATAAAKISGSRPAGSAVVWHRMGDAGYFDAAGRLWFCGRVAERVETADGPLHTEPCEQVFRPHPQVARCALIGLGERGQQEPALVVQPLGSADQAALAAGLRALARRHPHTAAIRRFFFHPSFPVDVRHNAKIHRLALARWAAGHNGHEVA
ncbi:MAG: fatty acid CoA ligase family protein [Verrucomicrobiota bacterium]